MKLALRIIAGLAVSAFFLSFALRGFDFAQLRVAIATLKYGYVLIATVMFCGVLGLRAFRWYIVVNSMAPVAYRHVLPTLAVGYLANNVLPARAGEVVRAAALARKTGLSFVAMGGTLVADRVTDLLGLASIMLVASALLPWDRIPIKTVLVTTVVGLVGMYVATRVLMRLRPSSDGGLKQKLLSFAAKVGEGFSAVRSPRRLASLFVVSIGLWMLDACTIMTLSYATGLNLRFEEAAGLLVGIAVGVAIPAAPGYVGTYEFFGKEALTMMGHEPATALTFVVLLHFFHLATIAAVGIPSLFLIGGVKKP